MADQALNMYDCSPCPRCGDTHRFPNREGVCVCDECGFEEPLPPGHYAANGRLDDADTRKGGG
jgi:hypothetical protein